MKLDFKNKLVCAEDGNRTIEQSKSCQVNS